MAREKLGWVLRPPGYLRWRLRERLGWQHLFHPFEILETPGGTIIHCQRCDEMVSAKLGVGAFLTADCKLCGRPLEVRLRDFVNGELGLECACGYIHELTATPK